MSSALDVLIESFDGLTIHSDCNKTGDCEHRVTGSMSGDQEVTLLLSGGEIDELLLDALFDVGFTETYYVSLSSFKQRKYCRLVLPEFFRTLFTSVFSASVEVALDSQQKISTPTERIKVAVEMTDALLKDLHTGQPTGFYTSGFANMREQLQGRIEASIGIEALKIRRDKILKELEPNDFGDYSFGGSMKQLDRILGTQNLIGFFQEIR